LGYLEILEILPSALLPNELRVVHVNQCDTEHGARSNHSLLSRSIPSGQIGVSVRAYNKIRDTRNCVQRARRGYIAL
jgi:hypothetical protein